MEKVREWVRKNKKLVALVIVALLGLIGVTIKEEQAGDVVDAIAGPPAIEAPATPAVANP